MRAILLVLLLFGLNDFMRAQEIPIKKGDTLSVLKVTKKSNGKFFLMHEGDRAKLYFKDMRHKTRRDSLKIIDNDKVAIGLDTIPLDQIIFLNARTTQSKQNAKIASIISGSVLVLGAGLVLLALNMDSILVFFILVPGLIMMGNGILSFIGSIGSVFLVANYSSKEYDFQIIEIYAP
jgi:hypothetical protein